MAELNEEDSEIRALNLHMIVPKKIYKNGVTPGIRGKEPMGIEADDETRWIFPERSPTEQEKRNLIVACLEIAVRTERSLRRRT